MTASVKACAVPGPPDVPVFGPVGRAPQGAECSAYKRVSAPLGNPGRPGGGAVEIIAPAAVDLIIRRY